MKPIFAGLMLFSFHLTNAQTTTVPSKKSNKDLPIEKMRAVIHSDEQQHQAKAPVMMNSNTNYAMNQTAGKTVQLPKLNYVQQHHNSLLEGLDNNLLLSKPYNRYSNASGMKYGDMQKYYKTQQSLTGTGNANALLGH